MLGSPSRRPSFSGAVNTEYHGHLYINGSEASLGWHRKLGSGGDIGSASFIGLLELSSNDTLEIRVETTSGSGNVFDMNDGQFIIKSAW